MYWLSDKKLLIFGFLLFCIVSFFYMFSDSCFPFMFGFVLAYLSAPLIENLSQHCSRSFVCFVFVVLFISVFITAGAFIIPKMKQYIMYFSENFSDHYDSFMDVFKQFLTADEIARYKSGLRDILQEVQKNSGQKIHIFNSILSGIASKRNAITGFLSFLIIAPISFFYFARDWNALTAKVYDFVPARQHQLVHDIFNVIRTSFSEFFHAQFYVVTALFAYYSFILFMLEVESPLLLGLISGLFSFIPFLGAVFACFLVIFMSAPSLTMTKFCIIAAAYSVGQLIEGYILSPKFVGTETGLHPLWILFAFFAGFELSGIMGVLIAIPVISICKGLINFYLSKFKASQMYKQ